MPIAISSQMNASLVALTNTNDDVGKTQNRLATGLAVATASDNISVYFKAQSYTTKASDLDTVNKGISQGVANLDTVDKALVNIQDTLKGALQIMKDARSKAVQPSLAVNVAGDTIYGSRPASATAPELKGKIVSTSSTLTANATIPTDVNDGTVFQQGDVFAITINDSSNTGPNGKITRYFRATSTEQAVSQTAQTINTTTGAFVNAAANGTIATATNAATADGSSQARAFNFNDLATLQAAIQTAFGNANITTSLVEQTAGSGNYKFGFSLPSASQSISFQQTNDQNQGNGPGGGLDPGTTFNFAALFGKQRGFVYDTQGVQQFTGNPPTPQVQYNQSPQQGLVTLNGVTTNAYTFSPIGSSPAALDSALQARKQAADFFRQTLYGVKNTVGDASLPGYANLLNGETLTIDLNETSTVKQTLKLAKAVDPASLGFVGYTDAGGAVNTTAASRDFNADPDLDTAIAQINTALATLKQNQTYLAAGKVQINARLDYNKSVVTTLSTGATAMTASDTTQEAANLAALQNRQSFATNNMAITKQAEQSLIQILR